MRRRFAIGLVGAILLAPVLLNGDRLAAEEDLFVERVVVQPGISSARLEVLATARAGLVEGFGVSITCDSSAVEIVDIRPAGAWLVANRPDFVTSKIDPVERVAALAVVFLPDVRDPNRGIPHAPDGELQPIAFLDLGVLPGPRPPTLPVTVRLDDDVIAFADGVPLLKNHLVIGGLAFLDGDPNLPLNRTDGGLFGIPFRRGDVDGNGKPEVTDPIDNLLFQFLGTFEPSCLDACDFNDDGRVDVSDPIGNLSHQFLGLPPPPPPGNRNCGPDPTGDDADGDTVFEDRGDDLGCAVYPDPGAADPEAPCP